ncbi:trigger factor [Desulfosediminicola flagellatus]|uniref:trigger factor n=1 Tax=Desulfosediminicola flagellatus TaxID=2569541 RepID=UPI0010AD4F32|nr:trigger factor [Desulfosediminicola flagellatus]
MEVNIEGVGALTKKLTITLPESEVQPRLNAEYDKLKKDSKMKGFRRGKVPRSVVVKNYKPQVEGEIGEKLVQETYFDVIEKENIDAVTHPEITSVNYNEDGSFTYIANVDTRPEFELGEYKGIEVEKPEVEISEEEIDAEIATLQKEMAVLRSVDDREIQNGDVVIVDFQGYHKGNEMKQVKNEDYSVDVGSGRMGPEFEEKLVGMKKGEEASHEVDFPESHPNPILKGKKVEFKIIVKDVKERVLADLNDEFAKEVSESFETIDALKESIRERKIKEREESAEGIITDRLMQKLLEAHDFEVPNRLVAFEIEQMIKQTEDQLKQSGITLEAAGLSKEKLAEQNADVAAKRVRGDFILKKIGEVEEIKVEDEDMERGFKRIGDQYNMTVAKVKEFFQSRDDLLPFMNELLNEKILHFLKEQAVMVAEKPVPAEDAEKKEEESEES